MICLPRHKHFFVLKKNNHSNHICRRSRGTSTQIRKLKAENLNVSEFLIFFFFFFGEGTK